GRRRPPRHPGAPRLHDPDGGAETRPVARRRRPDRRPQARQPDLRARRGRGQAPRRARDAARALAPRAMALRAVSWTRSREQVRYIWPEGAWLARTRLCEPCPGPGPGNRCVTTGWKRRVREGRGGG